MPPERVAVDPAAAAALADRLGAAELAASLRRIHLGLLAEDLDLTLPISRLEAVERWCAGAAADLRWRLAELARLPGLVEVSPGRVEGVVPASSLGELRVRYHWGRAAAVSVVSAWRRGDRQPAREWLATMGDVGDEVARATFFRFLGLDRTVRMGASLPNTTLTESRAHEAVEAALSSLRGSRGWSADDVAEAARIQPTLALADDLAALVESPTDPTMWAELQPLLDRLDLMSTDPLLAARLFERLGAENAVRAPVALLDLAGRAIVGVHDITERLDSYQRAFTAALDSAGQPGGLDPRFVDQTATVLNEVAGALVDAGQLDDPDVQPVGPGDATDTLTNAGLAAEAAEHIARALDAPALEMVSRTAGRVFTSVDLVNVLVIAGDEGVTSDDFIEEAAPLTLELVAMFPIPPLASALLIGASFLMKLAFTDPPGPPRHCNQNSNGSTGSRLDPQGVALPHNYQC